MKITKQNVRVCEAGHSQMVEGYAHPALPGLAIVHRGNWFLIHTNTGRSYAVVESKRVALRTLQELIAAGINWLGNLDTLDAITLDAITWHAIARARIGLPKQRLLFTLKCPRGWSESFQCQVDSNSLRIYA